MSIKWKGILVGALLSSTAFAHNDVGTIVRFNLTEKMKTFLKENAFDVAGVNYQTNEIDAVVSDEEMKLLQAQGAKFKFAFPQNLMAAPDDEYKNPREIEEFVKDIHGRFPEITAIKSIGKTLEGRDIYAIKISDNPDTDEVEPVILVNAMHHAREVMTPEITTDMVEYLVTNYRSNEEVTKWIENNEIWVIPMFNLDGNNKMWNENSMWRKNTRNGHGVDINRNYPTGWNSCNGSSSSTFAQDYRGTAPGSEPETQAMMNFVASIKPVFNISYHSYSEIVIYPFGCRPRKTPAEESVMEIGAEIGRKINYKPGTAWELLYNADGGDIDWMYTEHQVIPYVIEINSTSEGFHPDYAKWRDKTVQRNRAGWMHLLSRLEGASLQGLVGDKAYKTIKVFKTGSLTAFQNYKVNPDGSFYIVLKEGIYDFSFEGSERAEIKKFSGIEIKTKKVINL